MNGLWFAADDDDDDDDRLTRVRFDANLMFSVLLSQLQVVCE